MNPSLPPLTAEQWARVQEEFFSVRARSPAEQRAAVAALESGEPSVAAHLRALLTEAESGASVFDDAMGPLIEDVLKGETDPVPAGRLGPYRLIREVGRGGMGVVYLARNETSDEQVAIKILADAWIDPSRRDLFIAETQMLAALSHPSIAGLKHADRLPNGTPWFAMEYVEGEPITRWVEQHRLSVRETLRLFDALCAAVQHAHGHPIIHRDLKPSNVLVTHDGSIKLLDFGIAKRYGEAPGADERSRTTTYRLTAAYAAPEQLMGKVAGVTADVYALGIMLYELLVGRRPYELADVPIVEYEARIRAAWPPRIPRESTSTQVANAERRDLEAMLAAATAPDVGDRYNSVEAFRADIDRFLRQQPLQARKAGWAYRSRKFVRRQWREIAAAVALLSLAGAGLTLHNRSLAAARDVAIAEAARTNRLLRYIEDLFQGGEQTGPPDSIRVATLVENGIREARGLSADPVIQVDLLGTLGILSERLDNVPRADSLYQLAMAQAADLWGPDHPETLRARVRRAALLLRLGEPDSAELQLRALEALARNHAPGHPLIAEVNAALGSFLRERGRVAESFEYLERALAERRQQDTTSREYADALRELGNAYGSAGQLEQADSLWRSALPLVRRLFGPEHPDVAWLLVNLGNTASQRGRLDEAERYQREGLAITTAWYGEDHYLTGVVGTVLAQTLNRMERFEDAVPLSERAVASLTNTPEFGPNHPQTFIAHGNLATSLIGANRREEGLRELEHAYAGMRATVGDQHMSTITLGANLATQVLYDGHPDSAIVLFRSLLGDTLPIATQQHPVLNQVQVRLGEALLAAGRPEQAIATTSPAYDAIVASLGPDAAYANLARKVLYQAYLAIGDTARAGALSSEPADTMRPASLRSGAARVP